MSDAHWFERVRSQSCTEKPMSSAKKKFSYMKRKEPLVAQTLNTSQATDCGLTSERRSPVVVPVSTNKAWWELTSEAKDESGGGPSKAAAAGGFLRRKQNLKYDPL